jgi:hypothetical protein
MNQRIRNLLLNLFVATMSVFLFLVAFEIILRVGFPADQSEKLFCYDERYGWIFCPNTTARVGGWNGEYMHTVTTNSRSWRDEETLPRNGNIVVLGDSFTSNVGIENPANVFTEVMEHDFLPEYNVINMKDSHTSPRRCCSCSTCETIFMIISG